ncbi:MAG TPA: type II secretion system secretin GspD [Kofleriaceae bacterium]|nr:type II secretion system secretin GspD [Kofleriaceae bacterium]
MIATAQPAPTAGATAGSSSPTAPGEDDVLYSCKKAKGQVTVSFKPDTELKDLITWVMGFTCKNFIYDSSILTRSKKITIISPVKMNPQDAYRVFLVALSTMGLTVVPKGNVLRVVESGQARSETVPIYNKATPGNTDEIVRAIVRPNYLSVNELSNAFGVIKSPIGAVQPVAEANALIVTDYASSVRDMIQVMRDLDKPVASASIYTIKVKYADAKDLATKLNEILGLGQTGGGGGGPRPTPQANQVRPMGQDTTPAGGGGGSDVASALPSKIMSDDRTNTLIVLSNEAGYLRVKALVDRLDLPMELEAGGTIHVYPLQNADAEKLATTLNTALQGQGQRQGQGGAPGQPNQVQPRPIGGGGDVTGGASFEGQVRVTHDAPTNSLVVVSSGRDFLTLSDVIKRLDQPRRQVYIEAVILEVQLSNELDLGTSFHGGASDGNGGVILGGLQDPSLKSLDVTTLASATGLLGGLIGTPLTDSEKLLGKSIPSYGVLFQALGKNSNTNILSEPHILATDNEDSEISVGQNIPYIGGFSSLGFGAPTGGTTGSTSTGFPGFGQNIQRENLNLDMKIKPHVNGDDMVRLELEQEIKDIGDRDPQLGPTWTTRKIKTNVVVRDQQSIVIGGLMQDRVIYNESKIPLLGDIPILGYLFKYTTKQKKKTNLLILLTPYVIRDQFDLQQIVEKRVRERAEFLQSFKNLDDSKYMPHVDYHRKRGVIEEINRSVQSVEKEQEMLREFQRHGAEIPEGQVNYDVVPQPDEQPPATAPAPATTPAPGAAPQ